MAHGTTYSAMKALLVERLKDRIGLAGVAILYQAPFDPLDVNAFGGSREGIWFSDADGSFDNVVFCDGALRFDESILLNLSLQVLGSDSGDTQQITDERVEELAYEVLGEIASPEFRIAIEQTDPILSAFDYVLVTPELQVWHAGQLNGKVFAAGATLGIRVESRRSYP
jgi:hypothetical protein